MSQGPTVSGRVTVRACALTLHPLCHSPRDHGGMALWSASWGHRKLRKVPGSPTHEWEAWTRVPLLESPPHTSSCCEPVALGNHVLPGLLTAGARGPPAPEGPFPALHGHEGREEAGWPQGASQLLWRYQRAQVLSVWADLLPFPGPCHHGKQGFLLYRVVKSFSENLDKA